MDVLYNNQSYSTHGRYLECLHRICIGTGIKNMFLVGRSFWYEVRYLVCTPLFLCLVAYELTSNCCMKPSLYWLKRKFLDGFEKVLWVFVRWFMMFGHNASGEWADVQYCLWRTHLFRFFSFTKKLALLMGFAFLAKRKNNDFCWLLNWQ